MTSDLATAGGGSGHEHAAAVGVGLVGRAYRVPGVVVEEAWRVLEAGEPTAEHSQTLGLVGQAGEEGQHHHEPRHVLQVRAGDLAQEGVQTRASGVGEGEDLTGPPAGAGLLVTGDVAVTLEAAQRGVERAVADLAGRAGELVDASAQLVAVQRAVMEETEDLEVEHGSSVSHTYLESR